MLNTRRALESPFPPFTLCEPGSSQAQSRVLLLLLAHRCLPLLEVDPLHLRTHLGPSRPYTASTCGRTPAETSTTSHWTNSLAWTTRTISFCSYRSQELLQDLRWDLQAHLTLVEVSSTATLGPVLVDGPPRESSLPVWTCTLPSCSISFHLRSDIT